MDVPLNLQCAGYKVSSMLTFFASDLDLVYYMNPYVMAMSCLHHPPMAKVISANIITIEISQRRSLNR